MTSLGVDVGGTNIRAAWLDAPVHQRVHAPTSSVGASALAARIADLVTPLLATAQPEVVGIGVPGHVDAVEGTVRNAVHLGIGDDAYHLAGDVAHRLGVPVVVENDARAAALGALHLLQADRPDLTDLVLLNLGTGVSAGIVVDGRLVRGHNGLAGEIGHAPFGNDTTPCTCGGVGCLDAIAGGGALASRLGDRAQRLFATPSSSPSQADVVARTVAVALRQLAANHDPQLFVLGGGVARHAAPAIRAAVAEQSANSSFGTILLTPDRIVTLSHGSEPGLVGAALLGRQQPSPAIQMTPPAPSGLSQGELQ